MELLNVGRDKVPTPVDQVDDKTLEWYANTCRAAGPKAIAQREIARRGGGGKQATPAPKQERAIQRSAPTTLVEGSFGDPKRVTDALTRAAESYHLVSPASVCGTLPEGCEVCLSLVKISPSDPGLYRVGDKVGLDRVMLSQIAAAAGATVVESIRLDDGSHPHYCAWRCTIEFRLFDGQLVRRPGTVEIDVREPDGAAYVEIVGKAAKADRDPASQLLELRKFLIRHAESKALNRAIAAMGVRRSYKKEELTKPFAVARLQFTGRSEDPATKAQFNAAIAQSFLGGTQAMYGGNPAAPPALPAPGYHPPPPQGHRGDDDYYDTDGDDLPPSEPGAAAPAPAQAPAQAAPSTDEYPDREGPY
jgi:hypothetical protein